MTGREPPEWIGETPDTKIPPRVRLRVFKRHGGICYLAGRKIQPGDQWDCDHVIALVNGGQNRESNLAPALKDKHREKTARDVAEKSKVRKKEMLDLGIKPCRKKMQSRGFAKGPRRKPASAPLTKPLPPRRWT
jgi:5-methylcytosine-specific restriction enzyme A